MSELELQLVALGRRARRAGRRRTWLRACVERLEGRRPFPWRPLAVALAVLVVAVATAFAVPPARSAILRFFHLGGASVVRVETLPPAVERSQAGGLGEPLTRDAAERRVAFQLVLPSAGPPTCTCWATRSRQSSSALYGRPGPASPSSRDGAQFLEKLVAGRTDVERLQVDGQPASGSRAPRTCCSTSTAAAASATSRS